MGRGSAAKLVRSVASEGGGAELLGLPVASAMGVDVQMIILRLLRDDGERGFPLLELVEPTSEKGDLFAQLVEFRAELLHLGSGGASGRRWLRGCCLRDRGIAEEMGVADLARSGLARKRRGEWTGAVRVGQVARGVCRWTRGQAIERGVDGGDLVEGVETVGAGAQLAGCLRTAQQKKAQKRGLIAAKVEHGAGAVLELGDAALAHGRDEAKVLEDVQGLPEILLGEVEDGIAGGALVGGSLEGVERERVVFGRRDLFFDERAEDAKLGGGELLHIELGCHRPEDGFAPGLVRKVPDEVRYDTKVTELVALAASPVRDRG